jgi:hypothetical protein
MTMVLKTHAGAILGGVLLALAAAAPAFAGTIIKAQCPCGYHLEFMAGGGMSNFKTLCAAPAYCEACKKLEILNYLDDDPKCAACAGKPVFYNDPSLQEKLPPGTKTGTVFSWNTDKKGSFVLPDVKYLCPQCGKMTLRFVQNGFWD